MDNLAQKFEKYTYAHLLKMRDNKRYEIIDGKLYLMSAPSVLHQLIITELTVQIGNYLKDKKCKVFISPIDVRLSGNISNNEEQNVVQPDIMIVCDNKKIAEKSIIGAPEMIIEILSPNNKKMDIFYKFHLYQKYKVQEYWMIDLQEKLVYVYLLNREGIYTLPKIYEITEEIKVNTLEKLTISLKEFYEKNKELIEQ